MSAVFTIDTSYLTPSITIETIQLSDRNDDEDNNICYVYNQDGLYFYLFETVVELIKHFGPGISEHKFFDSEKKLDKYLEEL